MTTRKFSDSGPRNQFTFHVQSYSCRISGVRCVSLLLRVYRSYYTCATPMACRQPPAQPRRSVSRGSPGRTDILGNANICRRACESFSKSQSNAFSTALHFSHVGRCARNSLEHGIFENSLQGSTPSGFVFFFLGVSRSAHIICAHLLDVSRQNK